MSKERNKYLTKNTVLTKATFALFRVMSLRRACVCFGGAIQLDNGEFLICTN